MKSQILYFLLFIVILLTAHCETDVNSVDLPEFQQKLVITSFISPSDSISYFNISSNKKIYGEFDTEKPLGKLTGYISDGIEEVALDTSGDGLKLNQNILKVNYGATYKIRVSSESGLTAEAFCSIPEKRDFALELDTFSIITQVPPGMPTQQGNTYRSIGFKISFKDVPDEENFFRLAFASILYNTNQATHKSYTMEGSPSLEKEFVTDKGLDGTNISVKTLGNYSYYFNPPCDSVLLKVYLYHTEKSYFLYHKSLDDYNSGNNPFTEATPVFSNITGGLGVFTSYTIDSLILKFK